MRALDKAGTPDNIYLHCLPEGMPSFTPGRVLLLGESDGDRQRHIYTDGRGHPAAPEPSFFGHSIGRWEGDALVVDTVGVLPETYIAMGEAIGVANDEGLHVVERIHLTAPDTLADELTIEAPKVLGPALANHALFYRHRERSSEIGEGVCLPGRFAGGVDKDGDAAFVPLQFDAQGAPIPPKP